MTVSVENLWASDPFKLAPILLNCLPDSYEGPRTIRAVAAMYGCSFQATYKWLKTGKLKPTTAAKLVEMSEGKVTSRKLKPFVDRYITAVS